MTKLTHAKLREITGADNVSHSKKDDTWTFRREFFYTNGYTSDKYADKIAASLLQIPGHKSIVDHGEVWKPFRGGASTRASSHWYVTVRFADATTFENMKKFVAGEPQNQFVGCPTGGSECG